MSDFKSKLPDFKELSSMSSKLFKGLKNAVTEIIHDYKEKRVEQEAQKKADEALKAKEATVKPEATEIPEIKEPSVASTPETLEPPVTPIEISEKIKSAEPSNEETLDKK